MHASPYPYEFDAQIVHHNVGTYVYTVVFLPESIAAQMPFDKHPRLRISGELNEIPFEGAWQPVRGRWYVMLSKTLLKDAGVKVRDWVPVRFRIEDQDEVEVPHELRLALAEDADVLRAWEALSAGKRRGYAYQVLSAKTATTRAKRIAQVIEALKEG